VVTEIELVPSRVAVAADAIQATTFVLEARLWSGLPSDRSSILESAGVTLYWSVSPAAGVHFVGTPSGYHATVQVDKGTNLTTPITVKVQAGGKGADSQILPSGTSGDDLLQAAYTAARIPDAVVVRGLRGPADNPCAVWVAPGAVRTGVTGQVMDPCTGVAPGGGVAVLDPAHAMEMYPATWTSGVDNVPTTSPSAIRAIPVAMRVLVGGGANPADAMTYAQREVDVANATFADNRVGVKLDVVDKQIVPPPAGATVVRDCAQGDALTRTHDLSSPVPVLHVYMVDYLGGLDGFTCPGIDAPLPADDRLQTVIYLREGAHSVTILLHEVGHALGLTLPGAGHSDDLAGFDAANVMTSGYADTDDVWRTRLTVGQVLRMNADSGSWLNWAKDLGGNMLRDVAAPRVGCQCSADDLGGQCPRQIDDVAGPRGGLKTTHTLYCHDVVTLPPLAPTERPLALLAGRRWRTPPGECPRDLPGHWWPDGGVDFIQLDNLTRAGKCPSWLAIFFQTHEPIFRDLAKVEEKWSDAADNLDLNFTTNPPATVTLSPPRPVRVRVHYHLADETPAKVSAADADKVYNQTNRTGINLTIVLEQGTFSSCPAPLVGEFAVCYSSVPGKTVAQLIGTAWGLPDLTGPETSEDAFAGNAMQPAPGTGDKLTLGQIFRIHAKLGTPGFTLCSPPSASPCPPLEADVNP